MLANLAFTCSLLINIVISFSVHNFTKYTNENLVLIYLIIAILLKFPFYISATIDNRYLTNNPNQIIILQDHYHYEVIERRDFEKFEQRFQNKVDALNKSFEMLRETIYAPDGLMATKIQYDFYQRMQSNNQQSNHTQTYQIAPISDLSNNPITTNKTINNPTIINPTINNPTINNPTINNPTIDPERLRSKHRSVRR